MSNRNKILNILEDYWDQNLSSAMVRESIASKLLETVSTTEVEEEPIKDVVSNNKVTESQTSGVFEQEMKKVANECSA